MSTTLRSALRAELGWTWRDRAGQRLVTDSNRLAFGLELPDGPAAGQCDAVWHAADFAIPAGESRDLVLDALPLALFGGTITVALAAVKALLVVNTSAAGRLIVGGAATCPWLGPFGLAGDTVELPAGGPLVLTNLGDGWPVAVGANRLRLEALAADATLDLALLGVGA